MNWDKADQRLNEVLWAIREALASAGDLVDDLCDKDTVASGRARAVVSHLRFAESEAWSVWDALPTQNH